MDSAYVSWVMDALNIAQEYVLAYIFSHREEYVVYNDKTILKVKNDLNVTRFIRELNLHEIKYGHIQIIEVEKLEDYLNGTLYGKCLLKIKDDFR